MFNFVVKYLGFLKALPLAALVFDAVLLMWTFTINPRLLDTMDDIKAEVLSWPGVSESLHKYGGMQFNYKGREIGHIHGNGILDIRFSKKIKEQLLQDRIVKDHHIFTRSGWISYYLRGKQDTEYAINLLRQSYAKINLAPVK